MSFTGINTARESNTRQNNATPDRMSVAYVLALTPESESEDAAAAWALLTLAQRPTSPVEEEGPLPSLTPDSSSALPVSLPSGSSPQTPGVSPQDPAALPKRQRTMSVPGFTAINTGALADDIPAGPAPDSSPTSRRSKRARRSPANQVVRTASAASSTMGPLPLGVAPMPIEPRLKKNGNKANGTHRNHSNPHARTKVCLVVLIEGILQRAPQHRLALQSIYRALEEEQPWHKYEAETWDPADGIVPWKNHVRTALSKESQFVNEAAKPGEGCEAFHWWVLLEGEDRVRAEREADRAKTEKRASRGRG
jgi:hypothetical protein